MAVEHRSSPMLHVEGSSPQDDLVEIGMSVPCDRLQRIVHSESDSENEEVRFHIAQRKRQKRKHTAIDSRASSSSNTDSDPARRNSDDLPSGGQTLGSADTVYNRDMQGKPSRRGRI